jgi:hypothetical protein
MVKFWLKIVTSLLIVLAITLTVDGENTQYWGKTPKNTNSSFNLNNLSSIVEHFCSDGFQQLGYLFTCTNLANSLMQSLFLLNLFSKNKIIQYFFQTSDNQNMYLSFEHQYNLKV